ncbi:MAG: SocA family protein [Magnetococcales bacterium]|nr:SocA family protein [Magnetococcales bacterium]
MDHESTARDRLGLAVLLLTRRRAVNRTSLNKYLFFIDLLFLKHCERSLTDADYLKLDFGPVPRDIRDVCQELEWLGMLNEERRVIGRYFEYLYTANAERVDFVTVAELLGSLFSGKSPSPDVASVIEQVERRFQHTTASELSQRTHRHEPWRSALWGEVLDLRQGLADTELVSWLEGVVGVSTIFVNRAPGAASTGHASGS